MKYFLKKSDVHIILQNPHCAQVHMASWNSGRALSALVALSYVSCGFQLLLFNKKLFIRENFKYIQSKQNSIMNPYIPITQHHQIFKKICHSCFIYISSHPPLPHSTMIIFYVSFFVR